MDISVIICTYNRCKSLRRTLQSCCDLVIPAGVTWELIIGDNNSTDATRQVCDEFVGHLPLRYLFESRQGKSIVLNRSVHEATGALLLFTDDDVSLEKRWLAELHQAATTHRNLDFFGGKVVSGWEQPPPAWIADNLSWLRSYPRLDHGDCEKLLQTDQEEYVIGANIAFRREVYAAGHTYRTEIGPSGSDSSRTGRVGQEEVDFQETLFRAGHRGLYVPGAIVFHHDPPHRLTAQYIRKYYKCMGRSDALCMPRPDSKHNWFGVPRYIWRKFATECFRYGLTRPFGPSRLWLSAECSMFYCLGKISVYLTSPRPLPAGEDRNARQN